MQEEAVCLQNEVFVLQNNKYHFKTKKKSWLIALELAIPVILVFFFPQTMVF
jgi:uncharacterized membrane protein